MIPIARPQMGEDEKSRVWEAMASGSTDAGLYDRYSRRQSEFEHRGGYTWREGATRVLHNLGFGDADRLGLATLRVCARQIEALPEHRDRRAGTGRPVPARRR